MKKLLLLVLISFSSIPANATAYGNYMDDARFNGKHSITCKAYNKGYLTKDQKNDLLIEAYNNWNDGYNGNKLKRIKATESMFRIVTYKNKECMEDLKTYIKENIYPEI